MFHRFDLQYLWLGLSLKSFQKLKLNNTPAGSPLNVPDLPGKGLGICGVTPCMSSVSITMALHISNLQTKRVPLGTSKMQNRVLLPFQTFQGWYLEWINVQLQNLQGIQAAG